MFECPTCKSETSKLIYSKDFDNTRCPKCFEVKYASPTYLHQIYASDGKVKLTEAKAQIIANRIIGPGGQVIDRRTGKETQR